jgi:hypothetical protein
VPQVALAVLAVLGVTAYLGLCAAFLWFVVWPFAGWLVLVGVLLGALGALVVLLSAPFAADTDLLTPDDVDGPWFPPAPPGHGRDRAWPHYLAGQARVDVGAMARRGRVALGALWSPLGGLLNPRAWLALWPLGIAGFLLLLAVTAGAVVTGLAVLALVVTGLALAALVWGAAGRLLRAVDALLRRRNRAAARCPYCFWRTTLPGYACACGLVHHDVRPSRLGVLVHRCRCGRPMPTTVSRAGRDHAPRCPQCDEVLEDGSGVWTDVSIPVLGPVSAGKTSLIYAGLEALRRQAVAGGGTLEPRREADAARFREGVEQVRAGRVAKTEAAAPVGLVCTVTQGRRRALLHTFDAAGELFSTRSATEDLRFLDEAGQMIVVVDPFSIPEVADEVLRGPVDEAEAAPAVDPPEVAYEATVPRLRDFGARLDRTDLAVVVVKADLLVDHPIAADLRPDRLAVRRWLCDHGQDQLVVAAERDFAAVGYFLVSSHTGWEPDDRHTALAPLRWLAERGRLPLPPARSAVTVGAVGEPA